VVGELRLLNEWLLRELAEDRGGTADPAELRGEFVELGTGGRRYAVVAAGTVSATGAGKSRGMVRDLVATVDADGSLVITFPGYHPPSSLSDFTYVVKALPMVGAGNVTPLIVNFGNFTPAGIQLRVSSVDGKDVPRAALRKVPLMVEVCRDTRVPVER
jgi:hypothetical protein